MFGRYKTKKKPLIPYGHPQPPYKMDFKPIYHTCKVCGCQYTWVSHTQSGICESCYNEYLNNGQRIPVGLESIAHHYACNLDCYAEYQALFNLKYYKQITLEEFDQRVARLVDKYQAIDQQQEENSLVQQQKAEEERIENTNRLREMYKI